MPGLGLGLGFASPAVIRVRGGIDADAAAYIARMSEQPDAARQQAISAFVAALKGAGIWAKLDCIYLMAAHDAQAAALNVKADAYNLTGSPTFTTDRGFQSDGSTTFLDSGFTPSTAAGHYALQDASIWEWCLTDSASTAIDIGAAGTTVPVSIRSATTAVIGRLNATGNGTYTAGSSGVCMAGIERSGTTNRGFKNGVQAGVDVTGSAAASLPDVSITLLKYSTAYSPRQLAFAAWGASMFGLEASFYSATLAYMQAVGAA